MIQRAHRHLVLGCVLVGSSILGIDEATLDKVLTRSRFSRSWNVILVGDLVELTHCLNALGSSDLISLLVLVAFRSTELQLVSWTGDDLLAQLLLA